MRLFSVHVPKTGGTALRTAMEQTLAVSTWYYELAGPPNPDVIHGHLPVTVARQRWPGVPVVAFVRHPYRQVRSNYDHYRRAWRTEFEPGIGRLEQNLTFTEFIVHPKMGDYQSKFVDGPVDFLGTTERFASGVKKVNKMFGLDIPPPTLVNTTPDRTRLAADHRRLIDEHYAADLALFARATQ